MMTEQQPSAFFRISRIFLPFVVGYFLSFAYRTVTAVISPHLTAELSIAATALGVLAAMYFVTFAAFQPVVGVLLDRYGPRRVDSGLLLLAAGGAMLFALGENLQQLAVGRALVGAGVSAALMSSLTAIGQWWPREKLPLVNGLFVASGALGAVFATTPVQALLTITDWRGVFWGLAAATLVASALIFFTVPDRRADPAAAPVSLKALVGGMAQLLVSARFWRLAPTMAFTQSVFMAYISLWAGPWLRDVNGLAAEEVARHLQWAALGMVAGYAGFGLMAETLRRALGVAPLTVSAAGIACALSLQGLLVFGAPLPPAVVWTAYAFFAGAPFMGYAILAQQVPQELAGRANASLNFVMFVASFTIQSAVGGVIDLFPKTAAGYAPHAHAVALGGCLTLEIAAFVWMLYAQSRLKTHT
jgi:predicted MFS family arabinose efflux permease